MKKTLKYLLVTAAIFALALAVSLGIAASAEPSAEITYVNLSCKMNLDFLYAVKVDNLPDGAEVGVTVSIGSPDSEKVRVAEYKGDTDIKGETYRVYALPLNATEYSANL